MNARSPLTVFTARAIHTMDESLPQATAVAVADGRIVAVGDLASMAPWREGREVTVDTRFADKVLLPGLIDNHIHPFLGALLMPTEHIAPEPWRQADGSMRPAARTPEEYRRLLLERVAAHPDKSDWFISFGYQPSLHGKLGRVELDALFPDRPIMLIQRSFHESYLNSAATTKLGITAEIVAGHPQVDWADGHFFETGNKIVLGRLMPHFLRPEWYQRGLAMTAQLMQQGGITTAGDMLFGGVDAEYELAALDAVLHKGGAPMRVVNIFDARGFSNRAAGRSMGPPEQTIDFAAGLPAMEAMRERGGPKVWFSKAAKLFADGAMFSQLMQMNPPGYIDGHHGEWLMAPPVLASGVRTLWNAGWQIHVHVNGDAGMDSVLAALEAAQAERPRLDHRFFMHHVGYHAAAQTARISALGAHASVNPYYIHALADDYSRIGLGPERASQITRCGSLVRAGLKVSFHSDFMMAPPEPLLLAWCAATRTTREGRVVSPDERLTLQQALRGITIDAAWALRVEHEVGSISAGKRADFCVLEDDPFELGADGLKDVRVAGTVFEGVPHMLARPQAASVSALAAAAPVARKSASPYRPVSDACVADRCDIGRQWAAWFGQALAGLRPA
ncbi:MAG: amidohydrolase [Burkholderiales bacterium]|nr:amidohydrolase [Burkholderiales bacterium]MDE2396728.1 amidohydrolase [Burkholderiales bacterium]